MGGQLTVALCFLSFYLQCHLHLFDSIPLCLFLTKERLSSQVVQCGVFPFLFSAHFLSIVLSEETIKPYARVYTHNAKNVKEMKCNECPQNKGELTHQKKNEENIETTQYIVCGRQKGRVDKTRRQCIWWSGKCLWNQSISKGIKHVLQIVIIQFWCEWSRIVVQAQQLKHWRVGVVYCYFWGHIV